MIDFNKNSILANHKEQKTFATAAKHGKTVFLKFLLWMFLTIESVMHNRRELHGILNLSRKAANHKSLSQTSLTVWKFHYHANFKWQWAFWQRPRSFSPSCENHICVRHQFSAWDDVILYCLSSSVCSVRWEWKLWILIYLSNSLVIIKN